MKYEVYVKYRDKKKLKNYQVAKMAGVSEQYLSMWKRKVFEPNPKTIKKVIELLQIPLEEVLK